jgi:hypothetical protein
VISGMMTSPPERVFAPSGSWPQKGPTTRL